MNQKTLHLAWAAVAIGLSTGSTLALDFDENVTPDVIFGGGNVNGSYTVDRQDGVELGLRGKLRFPASNIFNSNGDGSYTFNPGSGTGPGSGFPKSEWSIEWSVNTNYDGSEPLRKVGDLTYEIGMDNDPGAGTDYLVFDPISIGGVIPWTVPVTKTYWDHAVGDNTTANGAGFDNAPDSPTYAGYLATYNVAQNSWQPTFHQNTAPYVWNPNATGRYEYYLAAFEGGTEVARTEITLLVYAADTLALETDACPDDYDANAGNGHQIAVQLLMRNLSQNATGFQAFLTYDDSVLTYLGGSSSYSGSPFPLHIQSITTAEVAPGEIRLDGSVNFFPPDPGTDDDSLLATLVFDVNTACASTSVDFDLTQLFDSELSLDGVPFPTTTLVNTGAFVLDDTAPVITCPGDVTVQCVEDADPGILYGVADGGVGIYYNDNGGGENPLNQAYLKAQFSYSNTNGAEYNFDATPLTGNGLLSWFVLYQAVPDQFGLDLVLQAPTWDGTVATPLLTAYDNTNNTLPGAAPAGSVAWAINGYTGASDGPANPANGIINSLIRGLAPNTGITITRNDVTLSGTVYTAVVEGQLVSTGTHYWYTIGVPNSPMSNFNLNGTFYFSGTLTYDSFGDSGSDLLDFFEGAITLTANFPSSEVGFATAVDNCTLFPVIAYSDVDNGGSGCPGDPLVITRTWTATDDCGNVSSCDQTITVEDTTDPEFLSTPADISANADAGGCTLTLTAAEIGAPTASDNCDAGTVITFVRSDGELAIDAPFDSADSPITITWTATDGCGNTAVHVQTVTVDDVNDVELAVELGTVWIPVTRCIHFVADDCDAVADVELSFVDHDGDDANMDGIVDGTEGGSDDPATPVRFDGTVEIPCGDWSQLCAKDEQHTKWDTAALVDAGDYYTAGLLTLDPGDDDNDGDVDIHDVTWFIVTYGDAAVDGGCPFNGARDADFSNNGMVGSEDYSRLTANWLTLTTCACTFVVHGPVVGDFGIHGFDVSVVTDAMPAAARKADLDRNGVFDHRDVRLFEKRHGLPGTLSKKIETTASLMSH